MRYIKQIIAVCCLLLLMISVGQIIQIRSQQKQNHGQIQKFIEVQKTEDKPVNTFIDEIENSVGWLTMSQTKSIDMPIMQGKDNEYYLTHNAFDEPNLLGAAFLDFQIPATSQHLIIHGHSTYEDDMFTELKYYLDEEYVKAHPSFLYYDKQGTYLCEIVSVYSFQPSDLSHYAINLDQEYLQLIQQYNYITTDVTLSEQDRLITLSTCDMRDTSYRILIHAKMNLLLDEPEYK